MDFNIILDKFLAEDLTPEELSFFLAAVKEPANETILLAIVGRKLEQKDYQGLSIEAKIPEMFRAMLDKAAAAAADDRPDHSATTNWPPTAVTRRIFPVRRIAAAVLLLLAGAGGYFIWTNRGQRATAQQAGPDSRFKNDIAPGGNKAILTLSNGQTILLDSSSNGTLARQGNTSVVKLNSGQLAYRPADGREPANQRQTATAAPAPLIYNTLSTPRGGQYQLALPDGSKVWLNAASSIRYPTAFSGKERKVEITGEAYFEIAKNAAMPFKVTIATRRGETGHDGGHKGEAGVENDGDANEIEVLGTSFNIMAYEDDTVASTTLLEGAVKITKGVTSRTIAPGQQLITGNKGSMRIIPDADVQKIIAWKNGKFIFYNDDIISIMKQLTRWYDIDVRMTGVVHDHYTGRISRQVNISQVLKMMEAAGGVSFSVQGKEVKIN
ncbi:MAG TPA: FecR domain-containing protein [Puia sp.]|nr:FecR domain-containing protein [Puia sp.]